ncbi:hypothetical protein [Ornithinibacillus californiensis]|uniref:hypothetical protein n=1 Tax=Ornithinibacillus californiensis TaxID=161536 RepID=UPI00064D77BC|nr:hypothetical protein [Ornithinibacillus californiensis]
MSIINFLLPFIFSFMITSTGISVIYFAIKNYRKESTKTFNSFIASFILCVAGLGSFIYGIEGFWWLFAY